MLNSNELRHLSQLTPPVLTAYLDINAVQPSARGLGPVYLPWLKKRAAAVTSDVRSSEQDLFKAQLAKIEDFLLSRKPRERGLVILAGPSTWELVPMERPVENELDWGKPALSQLFWLSAEDKSHCLVVLDRAGARFFHYSLGKISDLGKLAFSIDTSQWKKKDLGHFTGQRVVKTRGSQRDTFRHRIDAQFARLGREAAERTKNLCEIAQYSAVFLIGSSRMTKPIQAEFPEQFQPPVAVIDEDFGKFSLPALQKRLGPKIAEWEGKRQLDLFNNLLTDESGAVVGLDETLDLLQKGKLRKLVVGRELNEIVRECTDCGWMDRSADPVCPRCGRERIAVSLRDALPELLWRTETDVEVAAGEAERKLNESGRMGGWLRGHTQSELR